MENQSQLTVSDLAGIQQLMDAAASRGAFRAAEMHQVGAIYNKLTAFLESIAAQQQAAQPPTDELIDSTGDLPPATQGEENA